MIPESNVLQGEFIFLERFLRQILYGRKLFLLNVLDPVSHARVFDPQIDKAGFFTDFIGSYFKALNDFGIDLIPHQRDDQQKPQCG